jgi:hypothetical protein
MNKSNWIIVLILLFAAGTASAQDAGAVWNAVSQPAFDASKSAAVENVQITRDRIRITLVSGTIQFGQPANGVVFAAAFHGHGVVQIDPPNDLEKQQMQLLAKDDKINLEFSEATFSFTDGLYDDVARQVRWSPTSSGSLGDLYVKRQNEREDHAAEMVPRVFQGVLSADHKRTAYFAADLKTGDKGWLLVRYDALDPEEVSAGRWFDRDYLGEYETWSHFPAGKVTSSEAYRDPLAKELFVATGYKIDATVTPSTAVGPELAATTQVRIDERFSGERVIVFNLDANLRVDSVKDAQGAPLPFFQPREYKNRPLSYGNYIAVVIPQPSQAGKTETIEYHYAGKRVVNSVGKGNFYCPSLGWYPYMGNMYATRADFEMTFRVPKKFTVVATGDPVGEAKDGVSSWKSEIPLSAVSFSFGDYKEYDQKAGTVDVQVFINKEPDDRLSSKKNDASGDVMAMQDPNQRLGFSPHDTPGSWNSALEALNPASMSKEMAGEVGNSLNVFQAYFGHDAYKHLDVTNIPGSADTSTAARKLDEGAAESSRPSTNMLVTDVAGPSVSYLDWPGVLYIDVFKFLDNTVLAQFGQSDQFFDNEAFRAGETSYQWWGQRVGWKSYHDQWLSDGFAAFSGNLYVEHRVNWAAYLQRLQLDRKYLLYRNSYGQIRESVGPIWMGQRLASSVAPEGYSYDVYRKGGYVLHMIRMMLYDPRDPDPDHIFKDLMRDYCQTFDNKPASTEDFKTVLEKHMFKHMDIEGNQKMDWFFRQYVYGTGVPHYTFSYTAAENSGKWSVSGTITQSDVPDGWKDIVPIYIHLGTRVIRAGFWPVTGRTTPVQFFLGAKPDKVTINDNEDVLAIVSQ